MPTPTVLHNTNARGASEKKPSTMGSSDRDREWTFLPNCVWMGYISAAAKPRAIAHQCRGKIPEGSGRSRSAPETAMAAVSIQMRVSARERAPPRLAFKEWSTPSNRGPRVSGPGLPGPRDFPPSYTRPGQTGPGTTGRGHDHVAPDQVTPDQVTPDQVTPDQVTPDQVTPDQVTPDQVTPDQVTPDQVTPDQVTPDQVTPDHGVSRTPPSLAAPVQVLPFQSPPLQARPSAASGAQTSPRQGLPRMSRSPASSTPLRARCTLPRAASREPVPVDSCRPVPCSRWGGAAAAAATSITPAPWTPLAVLASFEALDTSRSLT